MKRLRLKNMLYAGMISAAALSSCTKDIVLGTDPYEGGKGSLGIGFYNNYASVEIAKPGELVDFYVKGIKPYLDDIEFSINETKVEVISAKDSLVTIRVPEQISSGAAKIVVDGQVFYGPQLQIESDMTVDENYGVINGFNGTVYDMIPNAGGYIVAGSFTNFENEAVLNVPENKKVYRNGIHFINGNGKTDAAMKFGKGAEGGGFINSLTKMTDGKFMIGGGFGTFHRFKAYNIGRINTNGTMDTVIVDVVNTTDKPENSRDTVSAFNGGVVGYPILKVFGVSDNRVIAVGNFKEYYKIDYTYSSRDNRKFLVTKATGVIRMLADGSLDSAFAKENLGANGIISDAVMIDNERVVVIGSFTTYNGSPAPGIVCIKSDGKVDPSFTVNGTIERIFSVTYNQALKKLAITGLFKGLGGRTDGVAVLNTDGSVDQDFVFGKIGNEVANFAQVLNNGRVIVKGTFKLYNGIPRASLVLLEKDGSLLQRFNGQAPFAGSIYKILETKSSLGKPALLMGGGIYQYGQKRIGNIVRLEVSE